MLNATTITTEFVGGKMILVHRTIQPYLFPGVILIILGATFAVALYATKKQIRIITRKRQHEVDSARL